jgi:hypothetical protein
LNGIRLLLPPKVGKQQKTFPERPDGPRDICWQGAKETTPPKRKNPPYSGTFPSIGSPPTLKQPSPNTGRIKTITIEAGRARRRCGAKDTCIAIPLGGPQSGGTATVSKQAALFANHSAYQPQNGRLKMTVMQRNLKTLNTYRMTTIQMTLDMIPTCTRNIGRMIPRHYIAKFL